MKLRALAHATSTTIITITALTIIAELYSPLKDTLTKIGSHHWVGKGIVATVVFVVTAVVLNRVLQQGITEQKALYGTIGTRGLCALRLLMFFSIELYSR